MPDAKPYRNFNFRVEIDGIAAASFAEVEVPDASIAVVEYREGADLSAARKLPGRASFGSVVLRRGITQDRELSDWFRAVLQGDLQQRNGSIVLMDAERNEVVRWNIFGSWPVKLEGPTLSGTGNEVAIETLELACESIERA